tara:strand:- start:1443 stop:1739 length:297 start_codon:yes stop_codon:yes gene_type:complete
MMRINFTKQASLDVDEMYLYGLINFGETQADLYSEKIKNGLKTIQANPEIGRLITSVNPAVRRFDFERHVIFYDINDDEILITRIIHCSMDYIRHLNL